MTDRDEQLRAALERVRDGYALPSLSAAAFVGSRVSSAAVGVRRVGYDTPVTVHDRYNLGSIGKTFTATLAARLVELGLTRWDARLGDAFSDLEVHEGLRGATLEMLLSHRAGLWHDTPDEHAYADGLGYTTETLRHPPVYEPGSGHAYSNAGYVVASCLLERAAGEAFWPLLERLVLAPLDMASARVASPTQPDSESEPWGHALHGTRLRSLEPGESANNAPAMIGAGLIECSMPDLAKFLMAHVRGARGEDGLVSSASFRRIHEDHTGGQGYGLGIGCVPRDWAGGTALWHSGGNNWFYAVYWLAPARDFGTVVACNFGYPHAGDLLDAASNEVGSLIESWLEA